MSKKRFSGGLGSLLGEEKTDLPTVEKERVTLEPEEIRTSIIIERTLIEKIRSIAYWDRILIKEVIKDALETKVEKYEKERGKIKPISKK